ncbi:hypothetical protein FisN_5Hh440 [Fistulifera solaris]|uniref:RING-type domain-containing protein n=1 Tax=Fistulifera solaris TaxID=1519565 RepID=A0A1Z5JSP9_FISSO|nr:hypothetical protein FisN_5Hh440 [Fistulifera solaris]|eukprot:GAX17055.1 hypothetical protein FisN_5Hh440 [Fistulifera solaris]
MTSRASKRKEWLEQETEQAILESTIDAVLSQASQGTPEMRKALLEMKELLKCSLCKCIYVDPVSLAACGHSFCRKCIENHNCDNAHCPECGLPVNMAKGSFEKVHATLQTVMDSFKIICTTLAQAEPEWWKYSDGDENMCPTIEIAKQIEDGEENENNDDGDEEIDLDAVQCSQ